MFIAVKLLEKTHIDDVHASGKSLVGLLCPNTRIGILMRYFRHSWRDLEEIGSFVL